MYIFNVLLCIFISASYGSLSMTCIHICLLSASKYHKIRLTYFFHCSYMSRSTAFLMACAPSERSVCTSSVWLEALQGTLLVGKDAKRLQVDSKDWSACVIVPACKECCALSHILFQNLDSYTVHSLFHDLLRVLLLVFKWYSSVLIHV